MKCVDRNLVSTCGLPFAGPPRSARHQASSSSVIMAVRDAPGWTPCPARTGPLPGKFRIRWPSAFLNECADAGQDGRVSCGVIAVKTSKIPTAVIKLSERNEVLAVAAANRIGKSPSLGTCVDEPPVSVGDMLRARCYVRQALLFPTSNGVMRTLRTVRHG